MQIQLSNEAMIEIMALANQTQCHPGHVFSSIMKRGHVAATIEAHALRAVDNLKKLDGTFNARNQSVANEPTPKNWRQALQLEPFKISTSHDTVLDEENLPIREVWQFKTDVQTLIQTDDVDKLNSYWYLTYKKTPGIEAVSSKDASKKSYAIMVSPDALNIARCIAALSAKTWVNKAQLLEALLPAIQAVVAPGAHQLLNQKSEEGLS